MRKVASIFLSLFFLLMSVGVMVNTHYCHSLHRVTTTFYVKKSCCNDSDMARKCCHNETKVVRLTSQYSAPATLALHPEFSLVKALTPSFQLLSLAGNSEAAQNVEYPPPLLHPGTSISVLYHSLVI